MVNESNLNKYITYALIESKTLSIPYNTNKHKDYF